MMNRTFGCACFAVVLAAFVLPGATLALEPDKDEWEKLQACEESVCNIILKKEPAGKNPSCSISKTWAKSTIKQGESKMVSWAFGDTQCRAKLEIDRAVIIKALTEDKYTLRVPTQTVKCVIMQDGQPQPVTAKAAPKIKFKNGRADKIWINLEKVDGPENVTGTISTIAALEDKLGIFHGSLIKSVNKFIHKRCAQKYGPEAKTAKGDKSPSKDAKAKTADGTSDGAKTGAKDIPAAKPDAAAKPETAKAKVTP